MASDLNVCARLAFARLLSVACVLLLAATASPASLAADKSGGVGIRADVPEAGVLGAKTDTPLRLRADLESAGAAAPGRSVHWSLEPSADAVLSHEDSLSSAGGKDQPPAGEASTLFTAHSPGDYTVTATTQANPGCTGQDCARWASAKFRISVSAVAAESDDGHHGGLLTALAGAGAAAAIFVSESRQDVQRDKLLSKVSGDNQTGIAGDPLAAPLVVRANNNDQAASGISIDWTVSGGATLSASTTTTDGSGVAQVSVTNVGPGPGPVTVTATRSDSGTSVSFTINVLQRTLVIVSGNGQSAPVSTQVPAPLVVQALLGGVPQGGIGITWVVVSGDATIASVSNGGNTNTSGQSSAVINLGPTPGTVIVRASRNDQPGVFQIFTINSTLIRSLSIVAGNNQTAPPNTPLPLPLVVNAQNNGANVAGVTINWFASGGATLSSATSVTNALGQASVTVTSTGPGPGPITVTASRADAPTVQVVFTENLVPPTLSIVSGNNQSGLSGSAATAPLDVLLLDGGGVPVSGQTISWSVISGSAVLASGSSVTNAAGRATMTFNYGSTPGPITIRASAYSGSQFVNFTETALAPSAVAKTSGDAQAGNPGQTLAPFVITIVPPPGATNLSGVPVTFTITSGTGTLSVTSTTTDAAGQASSTLTLGLTPGTVTVVAQVSGGPSTTFTATINGTIVTTTLVIVSGNAQTLSTGVASTPMVVELKDAGTPIAGQTVTWSTSNGTLSAGSTVTDAAGRASVTVTPSSSGPVVVTANFAAFAQYTASSTSFSHNTTLSSIGILNTDEAAVAVALDNACTALATSPVRTPEEQDLVDQCTALAAASLSNPAAAADALTEMLPDVAKTQTQTGEAAVNAQFDNLKGRMATLRTGVSGGSGLGGLTLSAPTGNVSLGLLAGLLMAEDGKQEEQTFERWGFFASGNIGRGRTDAIDDAPRYDFDIRGLTVGVDYRRSDTLVLGVAVGYTKQDTTLAGNQGSVGLRGFSLSGYSTLYREHSWYIDAALSFANNDYSHRRRLQYVLPGETVNQVASASSSGFDSSATLTLGRDFNYKAWNFGVYGRGLFSRQRFDDFDEHLNSSLNGSGLALHINSRTVNSLSSVLGGRASMTHSVSWGVVSPQFGVEWQREYSGDPDAFRAFLISDPTGTPILITGDALDASYFRVNIGLALILTKGRSGFIQYDRIFGRDNNSQDNLSLGIRVEF